MEVRISSKLKANGQEYAITSGQTVFFRVVEDVKSVRLMTATASEDFAPFQVYEDQAKLIASTLSVCSGRSIVVDAREDKCGRPFLELLDIDKGDLDHLMSSILNELGWTNDIDVLALQDGLRFFEEFAADDDDEEAYLSDGFRVAKDGRFISG